MVWTGNATGLDPESWGWSLAQGQFIPKTMDTDPSPKGTTQNGPLQLYDWMWNGVLHLHWLRVTLAVRLHVAHAKQTMNNCFNPHNRHIIMAEDDDSVPLQWY
jgi:prolipoprotein diacylglyceryltransferase